MKRKLRDYKKVEGGCQFGQEATQRCETCLFKTFKKEDWNYGWSNQMQVSTWRNWVRKVQNLWLHGIRKNHADEMSRVQD
jgi:hypothetical protein